MTWEEHLTEVRRLRTLCERHQSLLPVIFFPMLTEHLDAVEEDRFCRGRDPYGFVSAALSAFTDLEPDYREYNAQGYPVSVREARKRLRAYEPTSWQSDRLLGYASWIQIHGWQALDSRTAEQLQSEYRNAGIDPEAIDFAYPQNRPSDGLKQEAA